jgi:hypothetical protein
VHARDVQQGGDLTDARALGTQQSGLVPSRTSSAVGTARVLSLGFKSWIEMRFSSLLDGSGTADTVVPTLSIVSLHRRMGAKKAEMPAGVCASRMVILESLALLNHLNPVME